MNFLKKTGQSASIEARYLEGKARGFKHPPEVAEQLEIFKINIGEVKKLKKYVASLSKEEKSLISAEEKAAKVFADESTTENQNPKTGSVFRMFGDSRTQVAAQREVLLTTLQAIVSDWKVLSNQQIKLLDKNLDTANKTLVTRQYYESNKDYIPAKKEDEKYTTQICDWVQHVHDFRCQKEQLHPQLLLRTLQAECQFYKSTLNQYEMCEAAIRNLGQVEPIKFPGFFMEHKVYAGAEDAGKINTQNPYAGIQQQPQGYGGPPVQQTTVVTQTTYSQPLPQPSPMLPPVQPVGLRARGLYQFNGSSETELSFNVGDIMSIISQDGGWWTAELNGRRGFIPSNYVELC